MNEVGKIAKQILFYVVFFKLVKYNNLKKPIYMILRKTLKSLKCSEIKALFAFMIQKNHTDQSVYKIS